MAATNNKLIILICLLPHILFSSASAEDNDTKAYVDSWCKITKYQDRCVRSLSLYHVSSRDIQSPEKQVLSALKDSLTPGIDTFVLLEQLLPLLGGLSNMTIQELRIQLTDLVGKLTRIASMLNDLLSGRDGVGAKNNNLERLTSTALTDAETLVSKFQGRKLSKLEATIYEKLKNVEETTSIALSLIQHYAATRH